MLTVEQKNANELKFMELLFKLNIDLTELNKLLDSVDYFNKPASTQYFKAYPGGLCEHALSVAYELGSLANAYFPGRYTEEDIIKVAFFKDFYKATMYEVYAKNVKDEESGNWKTVPGYRTKDGQMRSVYGDIGLSSYMQLRNIIPFTDEQIEAILHSRQSDFTPDIHDVMRRFPLVQLTKMADGVATYF